MNFSLAILSDFVILVCGGRERLEEVEEILSLKRIASNIALGVYAIGVSYELVDRIHLHAFFLRKHAITTHYLTAQKTAILSKKLINTPAKCSDIGLVNKYTKCVHTKVIIGINIDKRRRKTQSDKSIECQNR